MVCCCVQAKAGQITKELPHLKNMPSVLTPLQCDFYTVSGNLNVLIMVDCWTKFVAVEPLRNKLQSVVGAAVAKFLGELGLLRQGGACL